MDNMEDKLSAILGNPQMMQQIMSMAQSFGQSQPKPAPEPPKQEAPMPNLDPAMIGKVMSLANQTGIDKNQQQLLKALSPYLTHQRISKLERAMRAAKLAGLAPSLFGSGLFHF